MTTIQAGFNPFFPSLEAFLPGAAGPANANAAVHLYALLHGGGDSFSAGGASGYAGQMAQAQGAMLQANMQLLGQLSAIMQQLNQSQAPGQIGMHSPLPGGAMPGMNFSPADLAWLMIQYFANALQQRQGGGGNCRCAGSLPRGGWGGGRSTGPWRGNGGSPTTTRGAGVAAPTGRGTSGDFLNAALAQNGDRYVFGAETNLNDANPNTFDCSELVQWAAHQAGVSIPDGSANQRAASIPISVEEAIRTPGALLFRDGHVAISLGDGRTIEAKGSRYGVGIFDARGRFTSGGLIPGMSYG